VPIQYPVLMGICEECRAQLQTCGPCTGASSDSTQYRASKVCRAPEDASPVLLVHWGCIDTIPVDYWRRLGCSSEGRAVTSCGHKRDGDERCGRRVAAMLLTRAPTARYDAMFCGSCGSWCRASRLASLPVRPHDRLRTSLQRSRLSLAERGNDSSSIR
jgi:hypothetical protein